MVGGMKMPLTALVLSSCLSLLSGCASAPDASAHRDGPATPDDASMTFVIVRHAEKVADGSKDPPLTEAGRARAQALAQRLSSVPVIAVYTTPLQRTTSGISDGTLFCPQAGATTCSPIQNRNHGSR